MLITTSKCSMAYPSLRERQRASCLPWAEIPRARGNIWARPTLTLAWLNWASISYTKHLVLVKYGPWGLVPGDLPHPFQKGQDWPLGAFNAISQFCLLCSVFPCFLCSVQGGGIPLSRNAHTLLLTHSWLEAVQNSFYVESSLYLCEINLTLLLLSLEIWQSILHRYFIDMSVKCFKHLQHTKC